MKRQNPYLVIKPNSLSIFKIIDGEFIIISDEQFGFIFKNEKHYLKFHDKRFKGFHVVKNAGEVKRKVEKLILLNRLMAWSRMSFPVEQKTGAG